MQLHQRIKRVFEDEKNAWYSMLLDFCCVCHNLVVVLGCTE